MAKTETHTNTIDGGYKECVVAFLDILGFKNAVANSEVEESTLQRIVTSLRVVNAIPSGGKKISMQNGRRRTIELRSRFFSDLLVFFMRKEEKRCRDIAQLFFTIRYLQDQLWDRGFSLRGSIVLGQMYWSPHDDKVTVGKGLIDAYERERDAVIYPRIVVSDDLFEYISAQNCPAEPFGNASTGLADLIRRDQDGVRFLDLLNSAVRRHEGELFDTKMGDGNFTIWYDPEAPSRLPAVLRQIDQIISDHTSCQVARIRMKYEWLKTYRNSHHG